MTAERATMPATAEQRSLFRFLASVSRRLEVDRAAESAAGIVRIAPKRGRS